MKKWESQGWIASMNRKSLYCLEPVISEREYVLLRITYWKKSKRIIIYPLNNKGVFAWIGSYTS